MKALGLLLLAPVFVGCSKTQELWRLPSPTGDVAAVVALRSGGGAAGFIVCEVALVALNKPEEERRRVFEIANQRLDGLEVKWLSGRHLQIRWAGGRPDPLERVAKSPADGSEIRVSALRADSGIRAARRS